MSDPEQKSVYERHFHTIALAIAVALLFWNFREVQSQSVSVAVIEAKVSSIESQLLGRLDDLERRLRAAEGQIQRGGLK